MTYDFYFGSVDFEGECNNRLIFNISYQIDDKLIEETMFICKDDGSYYFRNPGSKLLQYYTNGDISRLDYDAFWKYILSEANDWCRNVGYPELTNEI